MAGLLAEVATAPADEPSLSVSDLVPDAVELPALPSESSFHFSGIPTDASSNNASFTSTPPTTVADAASIASEASKPDISAALPNLDEPSAPTDRLEDTVTASCHHVTRSEQQTPRPSTPERTEETPTPRRARSTRTSAAGAPVYNIAKLSGTYIHGKRRSKGDDVRVKRRRSVSDDGLVASDHAGANPSLDSVVQRGIDALDINWSLSGPNTPRTIRDEVKARPAANKKASSTSGTSTRRSTRSSGAAAVAGALVTKASSLGKRSRRAFVSRELRRLQDTAEFTGRESKTVLHTIWSNGKYVDPNDLDENGDPVSRKGKQRASAAQPAPDAVAESSKEATPTVGTKQRRLKKWLDKGLYAGQPAPLDYTTGMSAAEKKKLAQLPELAPSGKVNKTLPLPMFAGLRLLINGRDFKLPYDVCHPLPPGQPKPDEWRKMTKSEESQVNV